MTEEREPRYHGIGTEFSTARIQNGMDVAEVATTLRIRKEHLSAIEEGRFNDLPAPAYALGFVRSYADYLGLDPAAAVEAFKQETNTSRRRTPLVFPTAEPVERVPRGWLLGMSAVLAAVVFGAWYYSERTGQAQVERVPAPPAEGGAIAGAAPANVAPFNNGLNVVDVRSANAAQPPRLDSPAAAVPSASAPPAAAPAAPASGGLLDAAISRVLGLLPVPAPVPPPIAAPAPAPAAAAAPVHAIAEEPLPAAAVVEPAPAPELAAIEPELEPDPAAGEPVAVLDEIGPVAPGIVAPPEPLVTTPAIISEPPPLPAVIALAVPPPVPAVTPIVPPAAPLDVAGLPAQGQTYGAPEGRVVIFAQQDSWVQVTGAAGELLMTRILRAGDKYIAPAREDLVLMTGNAGALEVSVDGKPLPPLGPQGTVRRNVSLSAEKLLAGTAVQP